MAVRGQVERHTLPKLLREFYLARRTGVLEVVQGDEVRRYFIVQGDLHLSNTHPLAGGLREFLRLQDLARHSVGSQTDSPPERAAALYELEALVRTMATALSAINTGQYIFDDDLARLPVDLVGPFPTSYLIMTLATIDRGEGELLHQLGGMDQRLEANTQAPALSQMFSIDPSEMFLLSRAEKPVSVSDLLQQLPGNRVSALRQICRLEAVNLLRRVDRSEASQKAGAAPDLLQAMVRRFHARIAERLAKEPLDLSPEAHRAQLGKLLAQVGSMTHYELLGVGFHDGEDQVTRAYEQLARIVHPCHLEKLRLVGREAAINLLFERATLAYLTLADSERRAAYNQEAGIEASRPPTSDERTLEQREVARGHFDRACELLENEDYHFAMELILQALRTDQQPEYHALLGDIQSKNPNWLKKAADSYRQAINLDGDNPSYRVALGKLLEQLGDSQRAKIHYRAALQKNPNYAPAVEALAELDGGTLKAGRTGGVLLERIRKFLE